EMRNRNWLKPEYFECLTRHQVAHLFNSWEAMPPVSEQMALLGSRTNPDLVAARFLLKPGRKYEQAVRAFEPYDQIKEENPVARAAGTALIREGQTVGPKRKTFLYVNNRLYAARGIKPVMPPRELCRVASAFLRLPQELDKSAVALAA
ncbi:MAG TPA: hypothetical protein VN673_06305, partial [Clostridia bacterium]|nr:hypothetical protein [Clostridia bacterium]